MNKIFKKILPISILTIFVGGCLNQQQTQLNNSEITNSGKNTINNNIINSNNNSGNTNIDLSELVNGVLTSSNSGFISGNYDLNETYLSPGGEETFKGKLVINNNVIESFDYTVTATNKVSNKYQNTFKEGIGKLIIGKDIKDIKIDKVNGSSLTAGAFDKALKKIIKD